MAEISIKFATNPSDVYEVLETTKHDDQLMLQSLDNPRLRDFSFRRMPQNYLVRNAKVLGMSNIILNSSGYASLENVCFNPKVTDKVIDASEDAFSSKGKQIIFSSSTEDFVNKAIFIGGHPNFGHWLFNHIARHCFIRDELMKDAVFLVPSSLNENQTEMLKYLGIGEHNIFHLKPGNLLNVKQLLIPQMPWNAITGLGVWWSPGVFSKLRGKLGLDKGALKNASRKIFLSRKKTKWRRLINEDQIYTDLKKFGFEMVDIGSLKLRDQFALGQETSCLITPIGANSNFFLNLPTGAKVIELAPPMDSMNVTGPFSEASGMIYRQIVGKANDAPEIPIIDQDYFLESSLLLNEYLSLVEKT